MAKKYPRGVTALGIARWPWLHMADTKFRSEGEYKVDLAVPAKDAADFIKQYDEVLKEEGKKNKAKAFHKAYLNEVDDQGNETGNVLIKCRNKNHMVDGNVWDRKPAMFDKAGKPLECEPSGGTTMKVAYELFPTFVNGKQFLSVQMRGVQIHDLVEYGSSAETLGFETEASDDQTVQSLETEDEDGDLF